ncbi:MAG: hypothetical protein V4644_03835, partial [Patescibacteria group bacterium]
SLTAGYTIPLTASTTDWNTAYLNRITSATPPLSITNNVISLSTAGDWTGTFDGQEGAYYLANSFSTTSANAYLATKTTDNLTEGTTNLYFSNARARSALSAGAGITYSTTTGVIALNNTGDWTGTFDGQEGAYYLARANHTGTQLAATISDFDVAADARIAAASTTIRGMFSSTATGLTYTSATGVFSLTGGYNIPLTASTTEWSTFYQTPSTRITAGSGLQWIGNTLSINGSTIDDGFYAQGGNAFGATAVLGTNDAFGLALETGGTTRVTIDTAGLVTVTGTISVADLNGTVSIGSSNTLTSMPSSSVAVGIANTLNGTSNGVALGYNNTVSGAFNAVSVGYGNTVSGEDASAFGAGITNSIDNSTQIGPSDAAKLTILSTGNLGVGTTSPSAKLSVAGTTMISGIATFLSGINVNAETFTDFTGFGLTNVGGVLTVSTSSLGLGTVGSGTTGQFPYYAANGTTLTATSSLSIATNGTVTASGNLNVNGVLDVGGILNSSSFFVGNNVSLAGYLEANGAIVTDASFLGIGTGGAASPDYSFQGDTQTGMFRATTGTIGFSAQGTERMRISSNGNVGIGTTSPYAKLSVAGTIVGANFVSTTTATSTFGGGIDLATGCFAVGGVCVGSGGGSGTVNTGTTGQFPYYAANGTALTATSSLFLATSGNVGVGSTSPTQRLSVTGSGSFSGGLGVGGAVPNEILFGQPMVLNVAGYSNLGGFRINAADGQNSIFSNINGTMGFTNNIGFPITFSSYNVVGGANPELVRIDTTTGNVGIGTTSPYAKLSVNGTIVGASFVSTTTATSTFGGGINLATGCFAIGGVCVGAGGGSGTVGTGTTGQFPYYAANGTTLTATSSLSIATNGDITIAKSLEVTEALLAPSIGTDFLSVTNILELDGFLIDENGFEGDPGNVLIASNTGTQWVATSTLGLGGGGGSGTVGTGTTGQFPYYAANGTTLTATSSLFLAANGNVGVASTSPASLLSLGAVNKNGLTIESTSGFFPLTVTSGGSSIFQVSPVTGDVNIAGVFNTATGVRVTSFGAYIGVLSGNRFVVNNGNIQVMSSTNAEVARFTDTSVGIGTTTPFAKLAIQGDANIRQLVVKANSTQTLNVFEVQNSAGVATAAISQDGIGSFTTAVFTPIVRTGNGNVALNLQDMTRTSAGNAINLGLGASNASGVVNIVSIAPTYTQSGTGGATDLYINRTETSLGSGAQYFAKFDVAGVNRFAFTNDGNFGIGTSSPYAKLSVNGTIVGANIVSTTTATSTFGGGIDLATGCFAIGGVCVGAGGGGGSGTVGTGTTGQFPYYAANGTTLTATSSLFMAANGNVGVGSTTPSAKLSVGGSLGVSGLTTLYGGVDIDDTVGLRLVDSGGNGSFTVYGGSSTNLEFYSKNVIFGNASAFNFENPVLLEESVSVLGPLLDGASSAGTNGMVLKSTGTGVQWVATSTLGLGGGGGSGTVGTGTIGQFPYYAANG